MPDSGIKRLEKKRCTGGQRWVKMGRKRPQGSFGGKIVAKHFAWLVVFLGSFAVSVFWGTWFDHQSPSFIGDWKNVAGWKWLLDPPSRKIGCHAAYVTPWYQ
eukprot:EG_transcript_39790